MMTSLSSFVCRNCRDFDTVRRVAFLSLCTKILVPKGEDKEFPVRHRGGSAPET
jgi:hypothetical protein